jgi:hypothetical protein
MPELQRLILDRVIRYDAYRQFLQNPDEFVDSLIETSALFDNFVANREILPRFSHPGPHYEAFRAVNVGKFAVVSKDAVASKDAEVSLAIQPSRYRHKIRGLLSRTLELWIPEDGFDFETASQGLTVNNGQSIGYNAINPRAAAVIPEAVDGLFDFKDLLEEIVKLES